MKLPKIALNDQCCNGFFSANFAKSPKVALNRQKSPYKGDLRSQSRPKSRFRNIKSRNVLGPRVKMLGYPSHESSHLPLATLIYDTSEMKLSALVLLSP